MFSIDTRVRHLATGALLALFTCLPALADDAEIYQAHPETGAQPNVLFVIDTSGSMNTDVDVTPAPYDPNTKYPSLGCRDDVIYYSKGSEPPDNCGSDVFIPRTQFFCDAAAAALTNIGGSGSWPALGLERAVAAQYDVDDDGELTWDSLHRQDAPVECEADDGIHGETTGSSKKWIANGDEGPWTSATKNLWGTLGDEDHKYRFFTANYMNWIRGPAGATKMTRLQIVRNVALNLASSLQNVNLGLMRYSPDGQGGYVLQPVRDITTNRQSIIDTLNGNDFRDNAGDGNTPLSETFYEASLYLQGATPVYGGAKSVASSMSGGKYISPIQFSCQKNYVVYLTDGAPTADANANEQIETMIHKSCANQTEPPHDGNWTPGSGVCMDELAGWMADETNTDLGSAVDENQNATTYMIGFGNTIAGARPFLDAIASAGGTGTAYTAGDVPTLTAALQTIFADLQEDSGTFITPSISVNAFNRAQTDNDLFFSLFKVNKTQHWDGNLKKYALDLTKGVVDSAGTVAVNDQGLFAEGTKSYWSALPDGGDVTKGGAISRQVAPDSRTLVTSVAGNDLLGQAENAITIANMTDARVGTGAATTGCSAACQDAINWVRGKDVDDENRNGNRTEQLRKFIGDPLHGRPAVVTYGKTTDTTPVSNTIVYLPTNDGFLHAIRGINDTAKGGGAELWAYSPPEVLLRLGGLRQTGASQHSYGLDGDVRVLRTDKNNNGVVDDDDVVYLFFGMRAGGNRYYALNVTDPTKPQLMWNIGPGELPGVGQTWSPPVVARVSVGGAGGNTDDPNKFVLIFGGGYDTTQESQTYGVDTVGNRIYMVDAVSGTLLWSAGGPGSDPAPTLLFDQTGKEMNNSIPARITVIDTNADGLADRMYAGDMGGRIWRFDITNGNEPDTLVAGGIIAKLGAGGISPAPAASENRRFYNAPDVALIQLRGFDPFYNIAIGSGYRGHPLDKDTHERFYSIRDKAPFASLTQTQYDGITPIADADTDLIDISADPAGTAVDADKVGWKLSMNMAFNGGPSWLGEKVLAEATTVANTILFTTFQPEDLQGRQPCFPTTVNRAYALSAFAGKPVINFYEQSGDSPNLLTNKDLFVDLKQQGIVGDVNVALVRNPSGTGAPQTVCLAGVELLKKCVNVGGTVRTFWNRADSK